MASSDLLILIIAGFFAGIFLFIMGFIWFREKRLIENTPTSKIRSLAMGLAEVFGKVLPYQGKVLKAPFSGKDCIHYRYQIDEYRRQGKHSRWVTVKKGTEGTPFLLQDNTGRVLVDPKGAKIDIPRDFQFQSGLGRDPPETIKRFLKANNLSFEGWLFGINKKMRYSECFIAPGDKLYIMGTASDNPFKEEATAKHGMEDVMIMKGEHEKTYYISDRPETEILNKLKFKAWGCIIGGPVLIILCLFAMLLYTGLL